MVLAWSGLLVLVVLNGSPTWIAVSKEDDLVASVTVPSPGKAGGLALRFILQTFRAYLCVRHCSRAKETQAPSLCLWRRLGLRP